MRSMSEAELAFQAGVYCHASALLRYPEDRRGGDAEAGDGATGAACEADAEDAGFGKSCSIDEGRLALESAAKGLAGLFAEGSRERELAESLARQAREASLLDLQRDYTALFIGALEMEACPYASYWLDGRRQLGGPTTVAVERVYRAYGMKLGQRRKQPGDHLATMLEFLFAVLRDAAQCAHEGDGKAASKLVGEAQAFFEGFAAPWIGDMCALVVKNAKTGFYRDLGEILPTILVEDSLLVENRDE